MEENNLPGKGKTTFKITLDKDWMTPFAQEYRLIFAKKGEVYQENEEFNKVFGKPVILENGDACYEFTVLDEDASKELDKIFEEYGKS